MKRIYYLYGGFLAMALLIGFACMKDDTNRHVDGKYDRGTLTAEEAREFFEGFVTEFKVAYLDNNFTKSGKKLVITPLWEKGQSFTCDGMPMVEIPFNLPLSSVQAIKDPSINNEATRLKNSVYRMLVCKTEEVEIEYYVACYTADFEYMRHWGNNPAKVSFINLSKFSGSIRYYDLSGNFVGGRVLKDGEDIGRIKPKGTEFLADLPWLQTHKTRTEYVEECHDVLVEHEHCTQVCVGDLGSEDDDSGGDTYCDDGNCEYDYISETQCYEVPVSSDDKGNNNTTSGGGANNGNNNGANDGANNPKVIQLKEVIVTAFPKLSTILLVNSLTLNNLNMYITSGYLGTLEKWLTIIVNGNSNNNNNKPNDKSNDPNCALAYLFNTLLNEANINLKILPGGILNAAGLYYPSTNTLDLFDYGNVQGTETGIYFYTFVHELLGHGGQDAMGLVPTKGAIYEYEVMLLTDFIEMKATGNIIFSTVPDSDRRAYKRAISKAAKANDISMLKGIGTKYANSFNKQWGSMYGNLNPTSSYTSLLDRLIQNDCKK